MGSFQSKICRRPRKRENENYCSVSFHSFPTRNRKFKKNNEKIQKIKKIPLWLHFKPKFVGKG